MNRYALIKNGTVANVVIWDGSDRWTPPADVELILVDEGWGFGPGDLYVDGEFLRPLPPEPEVDDEGYMVVDGVRMTDENGQWITATTYYGE